MAERLNRDPTYDLTRHIATGEKGPLSGHEVLRQYDAELDRNDPMEFPSPGQNMVIGQSADEVIRANAAQTVGLTGEDPYKNMEPVNMAQANDCFDSPEKGGLAYGPKNTGGY